MLVNDEPGPLTTSVSTGSFVTLPNPIVTSLLKTVAPPVTFSAPPPARPISNGPVFQIEPAPLTLATALGPLLWPDVPRAIVAPLVVTIPPFVMFNVAVVLDASLTYKLPRDEKPPPLTVKVDPPATRAMPSTVSFLPAPIVGFAPRKLPIVGSEFNCRSPANCNVPDCHIRRLIPVTVLNRSVPPFKVTLEELLIARSLAMLTAPVSVMFILAVPSRPTTALLPTASVPPEMAYAPCPVARSARIRLGTLFEPPD